MDEALVPPASGIHVYQEFESMPHEQVYARDVSHLFSSLELEASGIALAAALSSNDPYWRGWADAALAATRGHHRYDRNPFDTIYDREVLRISYASPLTVETLLKVPPALVDVAKRLFTGLFERLYFGAEEKERRQLDNQLLRESVISAQLDNIARAIDITNRIPDEAVREDVMREISYKLRGVHPDTQIGDDTTEYNKLRLTRGKILN